MDFIIAILENTSEKNRKVLITAMVHNNCIHKIDGDDVQRLLNVSGESKGIVLTLINKEIENFIGQSELNNQTTAHLKENIYEVWEYRCNDC